MRGRSQFNRIVFSPKPLTLNRGMSCAQEMLPFVWIGFGMLPLILAFLDRDYTRGLV